MSNSLHRRRKAALLRPVMTPVRRPAVTASVRPWPSCASNVLTSRAWLSGVDASVTLPSVSVPSTSINSTEICLALLASFAGIFAKVLSRSCLRSSVLSPRSPSVFRSESSHQFERPQIVQMHHAEHAPPLIHDHHRGNLFLLHQIQSLAGQHMRPNGLWSLRHPVRRSHFEHGTAMLLHQAPQVPVGQNPREPAVRLHHGGHAQALRAHFMKNIWHGGIPSDAR